MAPIPEDLRGRPFTVDEARQRGISREMLRGVRFARIFPRVFASVDLPLDHLTLIKAAQLYLGPSVAASHESGLLVHGVDIGQRNSVHVTTRDHQPTRVEGITVHRSFVLGTVREVDGLRVLEPERCLTDAATRRTLVDLVIAGDQLIRQRTLTRDSFHQFVHSTHFDGVVKSRRVADLLAEGSESPRESLLRVLLVLAGLPEPECNRAFGDRRGVVARLDLSYPDLKIAVEYDGRHHLTSVAQWEHDIIRREAMERDGWLFIVVTADHLRHPRQVVERVYAALRSRGFRGQRPEYGREWVSSLTR